MNTPTVCIIDDQDSVREALGEMLGVFGYRTELYQGAEDFLASKDSLASNPPEEPGCAIVDVRMPGMDGLELVRELKRRNIDLPVVLISGHADVAMAVAGIKAGAEDFIEKPVDDGPLVAAINRCFARNRAQQQQRESVRDLRQRFDRLTPREAEVFDLVVQGHTSQEISSRLGISTRTVESYRMQVMDKMMAANVAELVRQAVRLERIEP
ncbi:MAG: response regulator transcription factor [Variibacter sp.]|nr:response regulator transcription factor [Variibacter sp.]